MSEIVYGVSVGDYGAGLNRRAYLAGITAEADDRATFTATMADGDDREWDATPDQWRAAFAEFGRGYQFGRAAIAAEEEG